MKKLGIFLVCLVSMVFLMGGISEAATLNVCKSGCPYSSIQAAVNAAQSGDTIYIAAGTYNESINVSTVSGVPDVNGYKHLTIEGENKDTTIIDGCLQYNEWGNCIHYFANPYNPSVEGIRLFYIHPEDAHLAVTINNLTIKNGVTDDSARQSTYNIGSGIHAVNESPYKIDLTITNNIIKGNKAVGWYGDGAIAIMAKNEDIVVTLRNNQILNNHADADSGGILFLNFSNGKLLDVTMDNNVVQGNSASFGAGIMFFSDGRQENSTHVSANIVNNNIQFNSTTGCFSGYGTMGPAYGGGISIIARRNNTADVTLTGNTISNNHTSTGSGIYVGVERSNDCGTSCNAKVALNSSNNKIMTNGIPDSWKEGCNNSQSITNGGGVTIDVDSGLAQASEFTFSNDTIACNELYDLILETDDSGRAVISLNNSDIGSTRRYTGRTYDPNLCPVPPAGDMPCILTDLGTIYHTPSCEDLNGNQTLDVPTECSTVQDAVNNALNNYTIRIAEGIYRECIKVKKSGTLTIEGGWKQDFSGQIRNWQIYPASNPCQIDNSCGDAPTSLVPDYFTCIGNYCSSIDLGRTVISGDRNLNGTQDNRVFAIRPAGGALNLKIKDVTISDGSDDSNDTHGGGLYATTDLGSSTLTLDLINNHIKNNVTGADGAGMAIESYNGNITVTLSNDLFKDNIAEKEGGGILFMPYGSNIKVMMNDNYIYNNEARQGGGIAFYTGYDGYGRGKLNGQMSNNTFFNNRAYKIIDGGECRGNGGGIWVYLTSWGDDGQYNNGDYRFFIEMKNNSIIGNTAPLGSGMFAHTNYDQIGNNGEMLIISSDNIIEDNRIPTDCYNNPLIQRGGGVGLALLNPTIGDATSAFISSNDRIQNNDLNDLHLITSDGLLNEKMFMHNINSTIGSTVLYCTDNNNDAQCDAGIGGFLSNKIEKGSAVFNPVADGGSLDDNFDDNNDNGWTRVSGVWAVETSEYSGDVTVDSTVAISTRDGSDSAGNTIVEVDAKGQPLDGGPYPGLFTSGLIIFDYQNPEDFKYVHANIGDRRWTIGHRYNGVWNNITRVDDPTIDPNKWYRLKVVIAGNSVSVYADDDRDGSGFDLKASGVFDSMGSGHIGLGTILSHFHYDNFTIKQDVSASYTDNFDDGNDNGWTKYYGLEPDTGQGGWEVIDPNSNGDYVYSMHPIDPYWDKPAVSLRDGLFTAKNMSITVTAEDLNDPDRYNNFLIVFAYNEAANALYWAGAKVGMQKWVIEKRDLNTGAWIPLYTDNRGIDLSLSPNTTYNLKLVIYDNTVELYAKESTALDYGNPKVSYTFPASEYPSGIPIGKIGLGGIYNHAHFDDFNVNYDLSFTDDFNDGNNDGWGIISGNWSVVNGIYDGSFDSWGSAITVLNKGKTEGNPAIEVDFKIKNDSWEDMAFIIFDYKGPNDYKYAMARAADTKKWTIGYFNGSFNKIGEFIETIDTETWYRMKVAINGNTVTLYTKDLDSGGEYSQKLQATFDPFNNPIGNGQIGLKVFASHAQFDNFQVSYH